jgi:NAD(P)H-dependent flavin oxidoreductase YrpB (nitropropane dioxygenase family)
MDKGMYSGGQVVGRIHDVPTVAQLMERIINQALDAKKALDALF